MQPADDMDALGELTIQAAFLFRRRGVKPDASDHASAALADDIRANWGGLQVHFPLPENVARSPAADVFRDIHASAKRALSARGLPAAQATTLAQHLVATLQHHWACSKVYFPKVPDLTKRNLEIYRRFTAGEDKLLICRDYRISIQWLYAIVRSMRQRGGA